MSGEREKAAVPLGIAYNPHKAGLNARPVEEVNQIVSEAARGGRFYQNAERQQARLSEKIERLRAELKRAPSSSAAADAIVTEIECERGEMKKVYVCVDFDAFFSAVAELDDPSLIGKPHAIGGGTNSVLSTSSYKAREYGVRSAMPLFVAKRLCPELIVVRSNFDRYKELSKLATEKVFSKYAGDYFESKSLDECIFSVDSYCAEHGVSPEAAVEQMREEVKLVTGGLTVSAGVACTQVLAKIAADFNKPNGSYFIPNSREAVIAFCNALPVRKIPGIGKVTESYLTQGFGLERVGEILLPRNRAALHFALSEGKYRFLVANALGVSTWGEDVVDDSRGRKSVSRERTFSPSSDKKALRTMVGELCRKVADDISCLQGIVGGYGIGLKIKTSAFAVRTRSKKQAKLLATGKDIEVLALRLLDKEPPFDGRLLGIKVFDLAGPTIDAAKMQLSPGQCRMDSFLVHGSGAGFEAESQAKEHSAYGHCPASNISRVRTPGMSNTEPFLGAKGGVQTEGASHSKEPSRSRPCSALNIAKMQKPESPVGAGGCAEPPVVSALGTESRNVDCVRREPLVKSHPSPNSHQKVAEHDEVSEGLPSGMVCPVCNVSSYSDLILLNRHVDSCLTETGGFLQEARSLSRLREPHVQNSRKRQRRMDSYFKQIANE